MKLKENILNQKKKYLFKCGRCEITSKTKGSMCPCPRGGCEAYMYGISITGTIEYTCANEIPFEKQIDIALNDALADAWVKEMENEVEKMLPK